MNMNLKAVYYCATNGMRWGKGYTIAEAKKNAGIVTKKPSSQYYVQAALFNEPTEDELNNLFSCITANNIDGSACYYKDGRTEEDTNMINEKHVGWLIVEKNY